MQICLMNGKQHSNRLLTASNQNDPKSAFKYSLGHQNNLRTTLGRALSQHYVVNFEQVST